MIFEPDGGGDEVIGAGLKFFDDGEAVGESFFGADAFVEFGDFVNTVTLKSVAAEEGKGGDGRGFVEGSDAVGGRLFAAQAGNGFGIIEKFDELQAAAVRGEGVLGFIGAELQGFFRDIGVDRKLRSLGWGFENRWSGNVSAGNVGAESVCGKSGRESVSRASWQRLGRPKLRHEHIRPKPEQRETDYNDDDGGAVHRDQRRRDEGKRLKLEI